MESSHDSEIREFSTIEHDFLQVKDYFSNCKFIYKERKSKLDFLQNITNENINDTSDLLASSKEQLMNVKKVYSEIDAEIKEISQQIHECEVELETKSTMLSVLEQEETELIREHERLDDLYNKLRVNDSLNEELDSIESKIKETYQEIDRYNAQLESFDIDGKKREEMELRSTKTELAARQKRLTIINTDSYMEDIHCWYENVGEFLKNVFGEISLQMVDDRCLLRISDERGSVEVVLKEKKICELNVKRPFNEKEMELINECKAYCNSINDMRMLFGLFIKA